MKTTLLVSAQERQVETDWSFISPALFGTSGIVIGGMIAYCLGWL